MNKMQIKIADNSSMKQIKECLNPSSATKWVDIEHPHYKKLVINNNTITANQYVDVFGRVPISQQCSFSVAINKLRYILLGVIEKNVRDKKNPNFKDNWIFYRNDKYCYDGRNERINQGLGFKTGDVVTTAVDMV